VKKYFYRYIKKNKAIIILQEQC